MNLIVPTVGQEPGPTFAFDVNASLTLIDMHDHSPGKGVQITPAGMNINSDLSINENFLTNVAGVNLFAQSSPPGVNTLYESGVDLFFVDGLGNNIRMTQSGGVAGTPGSIANLVPPASATYVAGSKTFVWQSGTNIAANMDFASAIFRNITPNSTFGLTLQPPAGLSSNFTLTLPTIPGSSSFLQIDTLGVISGSIALSHGLTDANVAVGVQIPLVLQSVTNTDSVLGATGFVQASTATSYTLTVYTAVGASGRQLIIKKTSNDFNVLTISLVGSSTTTTTLNTQNEEIRLISDGNNWIIVNRVIPSSWQSATFGATGGFNGITTQSSFVKRVGDTLMCKVFLRFTNTSGTQGNITFPAGIQADTTMYGDSETMFGTWFGLVLNNNFGTSGRVGALYTTTGSPSQVTLSNTGTGASGFTPMTINSFIGGGDALSCEFTIPVLGWNG